MPALHQFVPTFDGGAVGTHIVEIRRALIDAGWHSEVFSEHTKPPYDGQARRYSDYDPGGRDEILLYHAAIGSSVADWLMSEHRRRLVVDYHNITPPGWFDGWEPPVAYGLGWGRAQLRRLARRSRFGLADSQFNADELETIGFRGTAVLPILLPPSSLDHPPDPVVRDRLAAGPGPRWVFVGRLAPNKRQHMLVAALSVYRRWYEPTATLALVGGASSPAYETALRRYAAELGVADAVEFAGNVTDAERNAYYEEADVFVCVSAHEGFCVPILEAWHHRVPVVAYGATAVPETLGDAGLVLQSAAAITVAAAVARVCGDDSLRGALQAAGAARLGEFSLARTRARLLELASALVEAR